MSRLTLPRPGLDPSRILFEEDFITGTYNTSGQAGAAGVNFTGGTGANLGGPAGHAGILQRATGSSINTLAYTRFGAASGIFTSAEKRELIWIVRPNNVDNKTRMRFGDGFDWTTEPMTRGLYFEKLDTDTNWFAVSCALGVTTRTDTGVAAAADWTKFRIRRIDDATAVFNLNNGADITITTNLAAAGTTTQIGCLITNTEASSKSVDLDYIGLLMTSLTRT